MEWGSKKQWLKTMTELFGFKLASREEVEHKLVSYFALKTEEFYKHGIYKIVNRWYKVQRNKGGYLDY